MHHLHFIFSLFDLYQITADNASDVREVLLQVEKIQL